MTTPDIGLNLDEQFFDSNPARSYRVRAPAEGEIEIINGALSTDMLLPSDHVAVMVVRVSNGERSIGITSVAANIPPALIDERGSQKLFNAAMKTAQINGLVG